MKVYSGDGIGSMYFQLIRDITENGRKITVRGQECLELPEPVCLVYEKSGACWMRIPGRKFNPFFMLAEVMWILGGNGDVDWISYFNSKMRDWSDGKEIFHGAYGLRIRQWPCHFAGYAYLDQIDFVVKKLIKDPFSRQAVISLWDPDKDNLIPSKDYPCNNLIYYSLRDGILDQTVVMRSNDIVWGTPHNAIQFTHLHALVAGNLDVEMGKFTYVIQNLHYYLNLYKPTLSHLIEKAYETQIRAESISSFGPIKEDDFEESLSSVNRILKVRNKGIFSRTLLTTSGSGYWGSLIPMMIWIFVAIKEGIEDNYLSNVVTTLPQPLMDMVLDFYKDSKNEHAQRLLQSIYREA